MITDTDLKDLIQKYPDFKSELRQMESDVKERWSEFSGGFPMFWSSQSLS